MDVQNKLKLWVKIALRPLFLPLIRRAKLPFDLLLPRIEALEGQFKALERQLHNRLLSGADLHDSIDSLTRVWLRLENEVAMLSSKVPEAAARVVNERLDGFEKRLAAEVGTVSRLNAIVEDLTRAWLQIRNETSTLAERQTALETQLPSAMAEIRNKVPALVARQTALETQLPLTITSARDAAIASLRGELDGLAAWLTNTDRHLHDDLTGRGKRVDDTLRFLLDRVEFVRRELLFEVRYCSHAGTGVSPERKQVTPRIVSPEKIERARAAGTLRLNLGCGHIPLPGFINVDMRDLPGVDVIAECGALPFESGSVDEIFSAHLVEHFPQEELIRRLLPYWQSLLRPNGTFRAVTPDGAAMVAGVADGSYGFEEFREVLFGGQDYEGDFHYNLLTPESLARVVEQAGFVAPEVPVRGRRNGACFEFELAARAVGANGETKMSA
jgi:hypothetical protein